MEAGKKSHRTSNAGGRSWKLKESRDRILTNPPKVPNSKVEITEMFSEVKVHQRKLVGNIDLQENCSKAEDSDPSQPAEVGDVQVQQDQDDEEGYQSCEDEDQDTRSEAASTPEEKSSPAQGSGESEVEEMELSNSINESPIISTDEDRVTESSSSGVSSGSKSDTLENTSGLFEQSPPPKMNEISSDSEESSDENENKEDIALADETAAATLGDKNKKVEVTTPEDERAALLDTATNLLEQIEKAAAQASCAMKSELPRSNDSEIIEEVSEMKNDHFSAMSMEIDTPPSEEEQQTKAGVENFALELQRKLEQVMNSDQEIIINKDVTDTNTQSFTVQSIPPIAPETKAEQESAPKMQVANLNPIHDLAKAEDLKQEIQPNTSDLKDPLMTHNDKIEILLQTADGLKKEVTPMKIQSDSGYQCSNKPQGTTPRVGFSRLPVSSHRRAHSSTPISKSAPGIGTFRLGTPRPGQRETKLLFQNTEQTKVVRSGANKRPEIKAKVDTGRGGAKTILKNGSGDVEKKKKPSSAQTVTWNLPTPTEKEEKPKVKLESPALMEVKKAEKPLPKEEQSEPLEETPEPAECPTPISEEKVAPLKLNFSVEEENSGAESSPMVVPNSEVNKSEESVEKGGAAPKVLFGAIVLGSLVFAAYYIYEHFEEVVEKTISTSKNFASKFSFE